jgi:hypothetical protein
MAYGVYRAGGSIAAVTTAKTLIYLTTPATAIIEIIRASITCENEDTSEQIVAELNRITTLLTPTATSITPKPTAEGMAAAATTAFLNVTAGESTYDTTGTAEIAKHGANKLAGWEYVPLLEERPIIKPSDNVGLRLLDDIANSCTLSAEIIFRELG